MDLLREISNKIDFIKSNPDQVDLDEICETLSLAHEVAQDGLNRSNRAAKYDKMKKEFDELSLELSELKTKSTDLEAKNTRLTGEIEVFSPLVEDIKSRLQGKVLLIGRYTVELRGLYKAKIDSATVSGLLELQTIIENDFNSEWKDKVNQKLLTKKSGQFVEDISNFKSGA